ncbi:e5906ee9-9ad3-4521-b200-a00e59d5b9b3 [Sclerotinia trifoliorum]|uniref:E5906ee9-9ad3-4521-b200-a00e59d5b9b3 n=1 Tax=Sclerotinia trifoliorum TaxID=28548 RepID=A0A8H2ZV23_9HELO|nr:e5906ee9-9ad3-4521-b200-a00e59d5b9b3 [Sclerotinia trifoliorum]
MATSALISYAMPTAVTDPLPELFTINSSQADLEPRKDKNHKKKPTPQLCAQKDLAFGEKTCTFVYQFNGDSATSFVVDTDCVMRKPGQVPNTVSTSHWSDQFRTCNVVKLNEVIQRTWKPTGEEYFMPLYQSDGRAMTEGQLGPSENGRLNADPKEACTLKYNDLPDKGAWYAWICPFKCDC